MQKVHADSGYCSLLEVTDCVELGVDLFAPVPERNGSKGRPMCSGEVQLSVDKMRIERRYGDGKKHRGGRELHGRGLSRATARTGLMVVAQNMLTLYMLVKRA